MPAEKIRDPLGAYLWTLRNRSHISQKAVADGMNARAGLGITQRRVNSWENGSKPMPLSYWKDFVLVLGSPELEPEPAFISLFAEEPVNSEPVKLSAEDLAARKAAEAAEEKTARISAAINKAKENLRLAKEAATREYDLAVAGARAKYKAQTEDFLTELNAAKAPHISRREALIAEAVFTYNQQIAELEKQA